jgi:hypothetical protein
MMSFCGGPGIVDAGLTAGGGGKGSPGLRFFFLALLTAPVESKPVSPAAGGIVAGAERVTGSGAARSAAR